jgi:hypothetical protein
MLLSFSATELGIVRFETWGHPDPDHKNKAIRHYERWRQVWKAEGPRPGLRLHVVQGTLESIVTYMNRTLERTIDLADSD